MAGSIRAPSPRSMRRLSHARNTAKVTPPASTSQITGESASHTGASGSGLHEPPRARAQNAKDDQPEAHRRLQGADQVEPDALLRGHVVHPPCQGEDHDDDHNLAGEHPPPRRVGGECAADDRPQRSRDGAGRGHPHA